MTNKTLKWDLIDGVGEYHILKYDEPNFNEATWDNHIVQTVMNNSYEIDEYDNHFYVIAYEKDNIICLSTPLVQRLPIDDGLVCDLSFDIDEKYRHPTVIEYRLKTKDFLSEKTGKSNVTNHYTDSQSVQYILNDDKPRLVRFNRPKDNGEKNYIEYENPTPFGTDDFTVEIVLSISIMSDFFAFLCSFGNIWVGANVSKNQFDVYNGSSTISFKDFNFINDRSYHKIRIERKNGIFYFYSNDFLFYTLNTRKTYALDDKFYIGCPFRNDNQLSATIIDYVKINGKIVRHKNVVGTNWRYTNKPFEYVYRNDNSKIISLNTPIAGDFTIIAYVHLFQADLNNNDRDRIYFDIDGLYPYLQKQSGRITVDGGQSYFQNEYIFENKFDTPISKMMYVRRNGVLYFIVNDVVMCSKKSSIQLNEFNCTFKNFGFQSMQVYNHSKFFNVDVGTNLIGKNNNVVYFTDFKFNDDNSLTLSYECEYPTATYKIYRDNELIGTTTEKQFTDKNPKENTCHHYHIDNGFYTSQPHAIYTHKYNPFFNAIGFDLCNNDGYAWDFRSTNIHLPTNDKTKQTPLKSLTPYYDGYKKSFGFVGGSYNSGNNYQNGYYHTKIKEPLNGDFTFEITFQPYRFYSFDMVLALFIGTEERKNYEVYLIVNSSGRLFVRVKDERNGVSNVVIIQNSGQLKVKTWHNVVLTRSGTTYTLYLDGKRLGSGSTNAKLGNVSMCIGANPHQVFPFNMIIDHFSLKNGFNVNGDFTLSKTLPTITDSHILFVDFSDKWNDITKNKHLNHTACYSFMTVADYSDKWFMSLGDKMIGLFYYQWNEPYFYGQTYMFEYDIIVTRESHIIYNNNNTYIMTNAQDNTHSFHFYTDWSRIAIDDAHIKMMTVIHQHKSGYYVINHFANGFNIGSRILNIANFRNFLSTMKFFDDAKSGMISNMRIYSNVTNSFKHDWKNGTPFYLRNSKNIDYRCSINKTSITIDDDGTADYIYDVFDDVGNKVLDGVRKGTHNATINKENYKIVERNSGLSFDKWIDLSDEHWDSVLFYHKFHYENDEKFNSPLQSRNELIFEKDGIMIGYHTIIHTRNIEFGTSDFTIEFEIKLPQGVGNDNIFYLNSMYEDYQYSNLVLNYDGGLRMADYNGALNNSFNICNNVGNNSVLSNGFFNKVVIMRKKGVLTYSVNDVEYWRTNSTHDIRPHYARNIAIAPHTRSYGISIKNLRITKSARY